MADNQQPMVIFDLSRTPPVVLTANHKFCQLFGYALEEVIGVPWKQFIHSDYIEYTSGKMQQVFPTFIGFLMSF
jgi:PAS domain S-box-containing protein